MANNRNLSLFNALLEDVKNGGGGGPSGPAGKRIKIEGDSQTRYLV
jgi:hypothetical protein